MRSLFSWFIPIVGLAAVTALAIYGFKPSESSDANPLLKTIQQQLAQGKTVVVYQMQNEDKSSEQYADWSSYLSDFSSAHAESYKIYETSRALNENITSNQIDVTDSYTLFMKADGPSYYYQGVIVEAMVYFVVDQAYAGLLNDGHKAFLPTEVMLEFEAVVK